MITDYVFWIESPFRSINIVDFAGDSDPVTPVHLHTCGHKVAVGSRVESEGVARVGTATTSLQKFGRDPFGHKNREVGSKSVVQPIVVAEEEAGGVGMDSDLVQKIIGEVFPDAATGPGCTGEDVDNASLAFFAQDLPTPEIEIV